MPAVSSTLAGAERKQKSDKRYVPPVISLDRPTEKELKKDDYMSYKLRVHPNDDNSPTYDLTVPFFRGGTPEELLMFIDRLSKVIQGQNLTNAPPRYALARRCLLGDALAAFNENAAAEETLEDFNNSLNGLIQHVFPCRAISIQKRYMRRFMRKPRSMTIRDFMTRITEVNTYLTKFPPFQAEQMLPQDEIMDIAEFAIPARWQKLMILHGFDPINSTPSEFIEFCERLEYAECTMLSSALHKK